MAALTQSAITATKFPEPTSAGIGRLAGRWLVLLVLLVFALGSFSGLAQIAADAPRTIRVVMDNNYPPFVFHSSEGKLQGILIDQWQAWEKQTGIKAEIHAMDWGEALQRMRAGEFDVIDTIFESTAREAYFDFSPAYARIEVPIFFRADISGITDLESLTGFPVAAKTGDYAVDVLNEDGRTTVLLFPNYEAIVEAAKQHKVNVFVVDAQPAFYFLNKLGIAGEFRHSAPVHIGEFHRAVRKGDAAMLRTMTAGFAAIDSGALKRIDEKWFGQTVTGGRYLVYVSYAAVVALLLLVGLLAWNRALRLRVRQRAAALRESETRFRELAENINEVFWVSDPKSHHKLYISPAYEKIWGRSCQSAYDAPQLWLESVRPEDRDRVVAALRLKHTQGVYDEEYRILRPDGTERWIRDRAFPVRAPDGVIKRWVGLAEDITERRKLEDQFRQAQKMEAIGTLAGGIAHDFNNILATISGFTELAGMTLQDNPEVRKHLDAVLRAAGRAADLTRQILTFSRQQPQERRPIQLFPIVTESIKLLRATIPSTIEFDTSVATDAPTVLADATQIHQVLLNLGANAWHAMKDRTGRLQVKLERCVVDAALAATQPQLRPGVYALVTVKDTGCGMDPPTLRRIFEPFFTTKPLGEGTGLGLAVVHGIMDNHDGAITVQSQPGEGTMFQLYFPEHGGEPAAAVAEEGPMPRGHGERVLVVDDEELIAQLIQQALIALGYEVEAATEPTAALALVRANPQRYALVLSDQTMPGMTGFFLASKLQQIRPGLPIILMTGYSASLTSGRIKAAGISQLLAKPVTIHSLAAAVHDALSAQPAPRSSSRSAPSKAPWPK